MNHKEFVCLGGKAKLSKNVSRSAMTGTNEFSRQLVLRKELIKDEKWRFSDDGFTTPRSLHLLQQLIISGPRKEPETSFPKNEFGRPVAILAEFIMNMVKTDKQNITVPKKLSMSLA